MDVLLSIKPKFAEKIFDGSKKYEYRKSVFCRSDINRVFVYASSPVKRIIGEFEILDILYDTPESLWNKTNIYSGIDREFFFQYFSGRHQAIAICIKYAKKYKNPINPNDIFSKFVAPQSYMYMHNSLSYSTMDFSSS